MERAAAAAGRTPAADDASGQSDSTARVGASGIRQAAAGGMAWRMGRPAQPSGPPPKLGGRTEMVPSAMRSSGGTIVAFVRMAKLWFGLQWVVVDRLSLIGACVTLHRES